MPKSIRIATLLLTALLPLNAQELFEPGNGRSPRWASFENPKSEKGAAGRENKTAKGRTAYLHSPLSEGRVAPILSSLKGKSALEPDGRRRPSRDFYG